MKKPENKNNTNTNNANDMKKLKTLATVNMILCVALIFGLFGCFVGIRNLHVIIDNTYEILGIEQSDIIIDGEYYLGEEIKSGETKDEIVALLESSVTDLLYNNTYISMYPDTEDSEEGTIVMHNKNGEAIAQTVDGEISLYLNNKNAVYFGEMITYGMDINPVRQLEIAVNSLKSGEDVAHLYDGGDIEVGHEYVIDIHGWDAIEAMYSLYDKSIGADMVQLMKTNFKSVNSNTDETDHPHIRFAYILDEYMNLRAAASYVYFGKNASGAWNNCYMIWGFEDVIEIYDWELGDAWYDYDYSKMSEDGQADVLADMLEATYDEVQAMLVQFEEDNGGSSSGNLTGSLDIEDGTEGTEDGTEGTEDSTEGTEDNGEATVKPTEDADESTESPTGG